MKQERLKFLPGTPTQRADSGLKLRQRVGGVPLSEVHAHRPVPGWATGITAALSRDRPPVVSRGMLADCIAHTGVRRSVERVERAVFGTDISVDC